MKQFLLAATACAALAFGSGTAFADACSGRDHTSGTILGALAGGVLGSAVSHGNGGAVVGGAILGGLAGNAISRDMDCEDRSYAARSYNDSFHGRVGQRYQWRRGPNRGYIVTNREYYLAGCWSRSKFEPVDAPGCSASANRTRYLCRDFTQVVYRRGREFDRDGTACRRDDQWEFL